MPNANNKTTQITRIGATKLLLNHPSTNRPTYPLSKTSHAMTRLITGRLQIRITTITPRIRLLHIDSPTSLYAVAVLWPFPFLLKPKWQRVAPLGRIHRLRYSTAPSFPIIFVTISIGHLWLFVTRYPGRSVSARWWTRPMRL